MSHVVSIKTEIKDLEALKEACKKCGLEFREGQKKYKWYGTHVGDYPRPEGFTAADDGKCDHAIGVPGNNQAYEIGVTKKKNGKEGFDITYDFWNGGYGLEKVAGKGCENLVDAYSQTVALKQATKFAQAQGWSVSHEFDQETNETVIKLRKY